MVALTELPSSLNDDLVRTCNGSASGQVSSGDSSRCGSLERKRRQGARVTLDADGKVVYSSESLRRRKGAHTTFEPGPNIRPEASFRPSPIGFSSSSPEAKPKPEVARVEATKSPPPFRLIRTQPDGDADERSTAGSPGSTVSRSDSYRMANEELGGSSGSPFQRNDSYRKANQQSLPASSMNGIIQKSATTQSVTSPLATLNGLNNSSSNNSNNSSNNSSAVNGGRSGKSARTGSVDKGTSTSTGSHLKPSNQLMIRPHTTLTGQFLSGHLRYFESSGRIHIRFRLHLH